MTGARTLMDVQSPNKQQFCWPNAKSTLSSSLQALSHLKTNIVVAAPIFFYQDLVDFDILSNLNIVI
jgi:hypothetical protein